MKTLFYIGLIGLGIFEIVNVYFIMPMPGSQHMNSIDVAYFLYTYRWYFRITFTVLIALGCLKAFQIKRPWIPAIPIIVVMGIIYMFNFKMTADHMFLQPERKVFNTKSENNLNDSSVVIAVNNGGEAKAYPIRFIVYHHQVRDTVGGKPVMITYCSVCRTGRVYEPVVNGKTETFRLVGMDHFNAMFEDERTKSWWRQATGEAIAGTLKGHALPEVESTQVTLGKFFFLNPLGKVMEAEQLSKNSYDTLGKFEKGRSKSDLTRTDSISWNDKAWVVGVQSGMESKAYDWKVLKKERIINDTIGKLPIVLALAQDNQSFTAFERLSATDIFSIQNDTLLVNGLHYNFGGVSTDAQQPKLKPVKAYQEFWHSWRTFHPRSRMYRQ